MKSSSPRSKKTSGAGGGSQDSILAEKSLKYLTGSLKKQWKRYRKELKRCQKQISEKAIHNSRIETRRLMATAELLAGFVSAPRLKKAQEAIKQYLDNFADLRDVQVQMPAVAKLLRQFPATRPFHSYLGKREGRFVKKTRRHLKGVPLGKLAKLFKALRDEVEHNLAECGSEKATVIVERSINRAFQRTRLLRKAINPSDTKSIHRTRVAFKKFRYMVEALEDYLPHVTDNYLDEMRHYQTMMGEIQDVVVLIEAFDKFLSKKEMKPGAASRFRGELVRRRQWLIRTYLDGANQLHDFWPLEERREPPQLEQESQ